MKRLHALLLLVFLVAGTTNISAQKELSEGSVTIGITELESSDPQAASMLPMFKSSTMKLDFNDAKSLMTMDMMSGMMKVRVLLDNKTSATTMLMDMMGQKSMTNISAEDAAKAKEENKGKALEDMPFDLDITHDRNDTKEILGHKCHKAVFNIKPKDEKDLKEMEKVDFSITAYVTKDIKYPAAMLQSYKEQMGTDLKLTEFPLEFSIKFNDGTNNGKLTLAATEIKKSIENSTFKLDTTGYEEMSMEDMMKKNGGF